jgi:transcriptional regulator with XRE-family HTH domain
MKAKGDLVRVRTGAVLKEARCNAGLTQRELAARIGMSRNAIAQIERGSRRLVLGTFLEIANALNADVEALMRDIWPGNAKKRKTCGLLGDAP